jgi:D-hydroxyproline dehydrogenase subunit beta
LLQDAQSIEPALRPGLVGVYAAEDLQVDPRATARAMGAAVPHRTGAEVVAVEAGGVTLAGGERIAADAVVLARGPWETELDVRPRRGQLVALGPAPGLVRHKVIDAAYPARVAAVIEEAITGEVYVGSTREDVGFDVAAPHQAALIARAAHFMPVLAELPVTRTWVGFRPYRPGGPFAGRLDSGVYAIGGHEGAGVGLGPLHGRQLAREIAES